MIFINLLINYDSFINHNNRKGAPWLVVQRLGLEAVTAMAWAQSLVGKLKPFKLYGQKKREESMHV